MTYSLSMFGKIIFALTRDNDIIAIYATGSLQKCGTTILKIVSPTDNFETKKEENDPNCQIVTVISMCIRI